METSDMFDDELEVDFFNMLLQAPEEDGEDEEGAFKDYLCGETRPSPKRQRLGSDVEFLPRPVGAIRSAEGVDNSSSLAAAAAASANPGSLTGGAVAETGPRPDFSKWTTEDDIILWSSMEAGYAFEALARQAMPFSQRYTVKELRERWRALLYDPAVSAAATERMHAAITKRARQRHAARQSGQSIPPPTRRRAMSLRSHYKRVKRQLAEAADGMGVHSEHAGIWHEANGDSTQAGYPSTEHIWLGANGEVQDYMHLPDMGGCYMPVGVDSHGGVMVGDDGQGKMMYEVRPQIGGCAAAVRPPPLDLSEVGGAPQSHSFDQLQLLSPFTPNEESSFSHMFSLLASGGVGAVVGAVAGKGEGQETVVERSPAIPLHVHGEQEIANSAYEAGPVHCTELRIPQEAHQNIPHGEANQASEELCQGGQSAGAGGAGVCSNTNVCVERKEPQRERAESLHEGSACHGQMGSPEAESECLLGGTEACSEGQALLLERGCLEEEQAGRCPNNQQACEQLLSDANCVSAEKRFDGLHGSNTKARSLQDIHHEQGPNGLAGDIVAVKCEMEQVVEQSNEGGHSLSLECGMEQLIGQNNESRDDLDDECEARRTSKTENVPGGRALEDGSNEHSLCRNGSNGKPLGGIQHPMPGAARAEPLAHLAVDCHLARPEGHQTGLTPQTPLALEAVSQRSSPSSIAPLELPHPPLDSEAASCQIESRQAQEKIACQTGDVQGGFGAADRLLNTVEGRVQLQVANESHPEIKLGHAIASGSGCQTQAFSACEVGSREGISMSAVADRPAKILATSELYAAFKGLIEDVGATCGSLDDMDADVWGDTPASVGPSSLPVCTLNRADTEIPTVDEPLEPEPQMEHYPGIVPAAGHVPMGVGAGWSAPLDYDQSTFIGTGARSYSPASQDEILPMEGVETEAEIVVMEHPNVGAAIGMMVPQGGGLGENDTNGGRETQEWNQERGGSAGAGVVERAGDVCASGEDSLMCEAKEVVSGDAIQGDKRPELGEGCAGNEGQEEEEGEDEEDDDDELPSFSDIEAMVLDMDLEPRGEGEISAQRESRSLYRKHRRTIVRLEQAANAKMARTLTKKRALAVLCGMTSRYYVKKPEVIVGRATMDVSVDIDLGLESRSNKVSRKQARIKMKESGVFCLENLGKKEIIVNNKSLQPRDRSILRNNSLIEVGGLRFIFEINHRLMRQRLFRPQTPEEDGGATSS